ncbi:hypothetical protein NMG60_11018359 [Bertholletia excelsa]
MAASVDDQQKEQPPLVDKEDEEPSTGEFEEEESEDFEEDEEEEERLASRQPTARMEKSKMENLFRRISTERVPLRVHDVIIRGNTKTKESLIEAEVTGLKEATSVQELLQAATVANARLHRLEIFDSVNITLDSGPPELPGTANVIVEIVETQSPLTGNIGIFSKPEARSWSLEGSLKLKNIFGYGDLWDGSLAYSWDQTSEVSAGVSLPRFKRLTTPVLARVSLLSQDWVKFSSYKERALGLSLGLLSSRNHDLTYNLSWRTLTDPLQMASRSIRRQLGHSLLSSLKYTYKIDQRNSPLRPTKGYAFVSTSQISGLIPDYRSLRFFRQEFDLLCSLGGPTTLLGFKTRGLGPTDRRRENKGNSNGESSDTNLERDFVGGDLALTAFADLSFDLPLRVFQEAGIHGHIFACVGNLTKVSENAHRDLSFQKFRDSFRSSAGFGIIVPTKIFRMEVNYCYILKQLGHDRGKTGVQFSFSSPL